jgi:hypothetical protein
MAREISPKLAMRSRKEILLIWRGTVSALCQNFENDWQRRIESLPVRLSVVEARRRDPDGSGGEHPPPERTTHL